MHLRALSPAAANVDRARCAADLDVRDPPIPRREPATARRHWRARCAGLLVATATTAAAAAAVGLTQLPQRWTEDDGRALALASLAGRRVVMTMAYAGCRVTCPQTIQQFERMQGRLDARGEHADFLIIGYDPENERPADWRAYRASRHLDRPNWHFVSGSRDDTERLARQLGFEFWKYDEHVMHGMRALVFDAHGQVERELGPEVKDWAKVL